MTKDGKLYRCLVSGIGMDVGAIMRDESLDRTEQTIKVDQAVRITRPERVEMYRMGE